MRLPRATPWENGTPKPQALKGRKALLSGIAPLQGFFDGRFITRGYAPLYPGLSHFTPSGLKIQIDYYRFNVPVIFADEERLIHIYKLEAQVTE